MSQRRTRRLPSMDEGSDRTLLLLELTGCPDLGVVDALARLHLAASRSGMRCELLGTGAGLTELLELIGLSGVVGQPVGQAEPWEQGRGVEEVVQMDDPSA